jgi:hypothetical protein
MYYSSSMFQSAGFSQRMALITSLGCGITNWVFALPAIYTIDTFGRRNLLLTTFPLMSIFLLFTGFSFWITAETARLACVATGIYLFMIVYSPGEGPVPFTYSAEAFVCRSFHANISTCASRLTGQITCSPFTFVTLVCPLPQPPLGASISSYLSRGPLSTTPSARRVRFHGTQRGTSLAGSSPTSASPRLKHYRLRSWIRSSRCRLPST